MTKADYELDRKLTARGIHIPLEDVRTLRRAELTLHRWYEAECGNSNRFGSWHYQRDERDGIPYCHETANGGTMHTYRIPDRENGAKRRVEAVCKQYGLNWYYQADPRGCALYVSREAVTDSNYSSVGVAIC